MISKEKLLKKIRKDVISESAKEGFEDQIAPPLKEVKIISDSCKIGSAKFYSWLNRTIKNNSIFYSHTKPYNKIYKILDPLIMEDNQVLPNLRVEIIGDEDPYTSSIGQIIELVPNDVIDLVGPEYMKR